MMFLQDSVKVYRVEYDNCINGPSTENDKHITLAINPYYYYNNRFSKAETGQHSYNQTENSVTKWTQKANILPRDAEVQPIYIPFKMSTPLVPFENDGVNRGHTEFIKDMSKSALTSEWPLEKNAQYHMLDSSRKQTTNGEAIVDIAANKHNRWNQIIHAYLWCPFVLFFVFFCCAPAILLMQKSDIAFRKGRDSEARRWALCSSLLYGLGLVFTLAFYAMIFALVFVYTK